jgi:glucose-1-phosphate cytidylyltransferase
MKVVLFCGGLGSRLREHSGAIPKPLVPVGDRPILWHLMKYYAHFGHREFILCLGYRADLIREYFDAEDEDEWSVSLVDCGVHATVGERLTAVAPLLKDEEMFLANYSDGLSDLPLDRYLQEFAASDAVGTLLCVRPSQTFHVVDVGASGVASQIRGARDADVWINGGFFAFRPAIFDYLHDGEDLVEPALHRLVEAGRLRAHRYDGFWTAMDTLKDKVELDAMEANRTAPWMMWTS